MSPMHSARNRHLPRAALGFSLVELMVAMTLSLLLLGGVVAIFASSRSSYETTERLSRIQETGRFALDQIVSDIRSSGFPGCARVPTYVGTSLRTSTDVKWNFLDASVRGYQYVSAATYSPVMALANTPSIVNGSDILVIRRPKRDSLPLRLQADMATGTATITVPNTTAAGLEVNDIALIYSCEALSYFQVTGFAGGTITHTDVIASATAPGNSTGDVSYAYRRNAEVLPVQTVIYYIGTSTTGPAGSTSLWRRIGANTTEELVEGVQQMQLRFGVDTTGDAVVDSYVTANAVTDWTAVYSVEVALLVRSLDGYGGDRDAETYQLADVTVAAANDNLMREVFTASVGVRNRVPAN